MKKLLLIALFISPAYAEQFELRDLSGGMYSNASPNVIPDNSAFYIQNFVTDVEPILVERNGYSKRDTTQLGGIKPVTGLWEFQDNAGNQWVISFSSRTFYKNTVGQTPTAFGPNVTVDQAPDCAVNLGNLWCVNGSDPGWSFDGTSTATVSGVPLGKLIESWRNRLVVSNISGSQSTVRFSADGDGTDWTLGGNPTDPFSIQIGGANDGFNVTCMWGSYLDNMIFGRKRDLWALSGFDQADITLRNVSSEIGCLQDGSMREFDGSLLFLSARGMEEMRGITIQHISEPVRNITDEIVKNTANERSIVQTTNSDWGAGSFDSLVYVDTETVSGNLQTTFPDDFSELRDGSNGTKTVWKIGSDNDASIGSVSSNGSELVMTHNYSIGGERQWIRMNQATNDLRSGTTFHFVISSMTTQAVVPAAIRCVLSTASVEATGNILTAVGLSSPYIEFRSTTSMAVTFGTDSLDPCGNTILFSTSIPLPMTIDIFWSTNTFNFTINETSSVVSACPNPPGSRNMRQYFILRNTSGSQATVKIDDFSIAPQTFTYTSQLLNPGTLITSWRPFDINQSLGDGTIQYQIGSTNTASVSAITNYQSISDSAVPTIATGAYAAVKAYFITDEWDDTPTLNDFTISWSEGELQPIKSWNYDRRYWLSFTTNTAGGSFNDTILVYQRNRTWTLFKGINASSFATWRDALYFGNSNSTGYVYKFDTGNTDDGSDIESRLITKSYDLGDFVREKSFHTAFLNYNGALAKSGTFDLKYKFNQVDSTESTLKSFSMTENLPGSVRKAGFPRGNLVQGREIQYTLNKVGTGDRLKLYSIWTRYSPKEVR